MLAPILVALTALTGSTLAVPVSSASSCTAQQRIAYAQQIPYAYSQATIAQTYNTFAAIPFGVPDLPGPCTTTIYPNGGSGVVVGTTGQGVVNFGTLSRQVFSQVTGTYKDFGANGTTVIYTQVTLGVSSDVPIPVTFSGQVYVDFNTNCRVTAVRAYAEIPTEINGKPTNLYQFLGIPQTGTVT